MAEFETADAAHRRHPGGQGRPGTTGWTGTPRTRSREVADALGFPRSEIGAIMFIGGLCGATLGFLMQYYLNGIDYPLNVGGKPFFSWPQFVPITWELLVLTASLSGLFGLFALCGLPQPYHPLFNVPQFDRASRDRFFLVIEATDPKFDPAATGRSWPRSTRPASRRCRNEPCERRTQNAKRKKGHRLRRRRLHFCALRLDFALRPAASRRWPSSRPSGRTRQSETFAHNQSARPLESGRRPPQPAARRRPARHLADRRGEEGRAGGKFGEEAAGRPEGRDACRRWARRTRSTTSSTSSRSR